MPGQPLAYCVCFMPPLQIILGTCIPHRAGPERAVGPGGLCPCTVLCGFKQHWLSSKAMPTRSLWVKDVSHIPLQGGSGLSAGPFLLAHVWRGWDLGARNMLPEPSPAVRSWGSSAQHR